MRASAWWLKVKHVQWQEFVIVGYTAGSGATYGRPLPHGAVVLGYREGEQLKYAGRVGSGFDQPTLVLLREALQQLRSDSSPFQQTPATERRSTTWVHPSW